MGTIKSEKKAKKTESNFPWKEVLAFLGVIIAAYIGYLGIRSQVEIPIRATQTAEAKAIVNAPESAIEEPYNILTPTPDSCSSAKIVSPNGTQHPEITGNDFMPAYLTFSISWVPSNCIMTVVIDGSNSQGVYYNVKSGETFNAMAKLRKGEGRVEISIWAYGMDYKTGLPTNSIFVFVENTPAINSTPPNP